MASESASRAFMSDAKELVDAGQFSKAIAVLQEGLKKFPKMVSARVLLGEIYRTSGDLALARVELEQVIKAAPDNFAACRKLAVVYRDLGDKPAALKACETILKANPKDREMGQLRDQLQGGAKAGKAKAGDKAAPAKKARRPEKREAARTEETVKEAPVTIPTAEPPVVEVAASESAGAGRSLAIAVARDVTDTEMPAELYVAQGHPEKGLEVYRRLAVKEPHNLRLHEKIQRLAEGGARGRQAPAADKPELPDKAKRPEKREAAPPVAEHAASESAGAGRSLALEGAGDITDSEMLAEHYIAQGHPEKGLEVYRRLVAKDPDNVRLHENIIALEEEGAGASRRAPAKASPETSAQAKRKARIRRLEGWLARIRERRRSGRSWFSTGRT